MVKYDEAKQCIVVPALNDAPLTHVSPALFVNCDEKPLNIYSVKANACGHAVAPGRAGTWTMTSLFNKERVIYTQVIARGDSLSLQGVEVVRV